MLHKGTEDALVIFMLGFRAPTHTLLLPACLCTGLEGAIGGGAWGEESPERRLGKQCDVLLAVSRDHHSS